MDLEYFLEQDQRTQGDTALKKRDRIFYLNQIRSEPDPMVSPNRGDGKRDQPLGKQLIFHWLGLRRSEEEQKQGQTTRLPGSIYRETASLMTWLFFLGGMFLGITVVASFFSYAGTRPLNISYYLCLTLVGQLILLVLTLTGFVLAGTGRAASSMPVLQRFFGVLVHRMVQKIKEKSMGHISGDYQASMACALGLIRAKHRIYGPLFLWPLFILGQLFALGFNTGVLGTTLARVFFSDTAFGWQSTLKVGPELVHDLVSFLALPWSWLIPPGIASPTMEQIAGSRMVLKDGIYHLTTGDLISWWPFLCFCVFFYGFLPRLLLVGVGHWMKTRSIAALTFDHASCQRLLTRMITPLVSIDGALSPSTVSSPMESISAPPFVQDQKCAHPAEYTSPPEQPDHDLADHDCNAGHDCNLLINDQQSKKEANTTFRASPSSPPPSFPDPPGPFRRSLVLVSEDLAEGMMDGNELAQQVLIHCGSTLVDQITVGGDSDGELEIIRAKCDAPDFPHKNSPGPISSIVWVHEAWQPPIKETLSFLRGLRRVTGEKMDIVVGLVGKPSAKTLFSPPGDMDLLVWQKKLDALGDPWLRIESLEVRS